MTDQLIEKLSSKKERQRIRAYKKLLPSLNSLKEEVPKCRNINLEVRVGCGENDCTPSLAVFKAKRLSLPLISAVGYASLSAVKELYKTAEPSLIAFYNGAEVSVSFPNEEKPLKAMAIGIPLKQAKSFDGELAEYRRLHVGYLKKRVDRINQIFKSYKIKIQNFDKCLKGTDAVGEKAIFDLLSGEVMAHFQSAEEILGFLKEKLKFDLSDGEMAKLQDLVSPLYKEDLSAILQNRLVIRQEPEKCKSYKHFAAMTVANGAIPAVIYDGKADSAGEFIQSAKERGFLSVIINHGDEELAKVVYDECVKFGLLPLCRVLIDRSRVDFEASFDDEDLAEKYNECAYAVVGHEICTAINFFDGLFSKELLKNVTAVEDRIKLYSRIGAKGKV